MRRALAMAALVLAFGLGWQPQSFSDGVSAQEATPAAVAPDLVTLDTTLVGLLPGVSLPAHADIVAVRTVFAPGVEVPFASGPDSADTLFLVERGELTFEVENQAWQISRQSILNEAMASSAPNGDLFDLSTTIEPGEQGVLGAGDMTLIPASADGTMRNAASDSATVLMILMGPGSGDATPVP